MTHFRRQTLAQTISRCIISLVNCIAGLVRRLAVAATNSFARGAETAVGACSLARKSFNAVPGTKFRCCAPLLARLRTGGEGSNLAFHAAQSTANIPPRDQPLSSGIFGTWSFSSALVQYSPLDRPVSRPHLNVGLREPITQLQAVRNASMKRRCPDFVCPSICTRKQLCCCRPLEPLFMAPSTGLWQFGGERFKRLDRNVFQSGSRRMMQRIMVTPARPPTPAIPPARRVSSR
jgi:hypothetical protein